MDRRSWLWRRKSSEKIPGETESSIGSVSSHSERFSDDQVYLSQNSQSLEVTLRESEHNHGMKTLSEKLSEALSIINEKEELINQHVKVAEEAVSGWEKAEREVLSLKQQVEVLSVRNSTLEDRVVHLDGALKECMNQLRQTREEKDQIAHEALEKKNSENESSLTSIDTDELFHKLEMVEKENSDLKLELSSMAEELEIRLIERDLSNQAAEQASKQHLESIKKVAKFEGECSRLNTALQKANNHKPKARKTPSITEKGDLKETSICWRNQIDSFENIDFMDDFLEMEKLVALNESSEVKENINKVESLEVVLKERENELKVSRGQLEKAESKLEELENELKTSRNQFEESESKLVDYENELLASRNQLHESESKFAERENELLASRNQLQESESKFAERENELKGSRDRVKECENELKASRYRLEEVESKLAESKKELKASKHRLQKTESKLAERENELKKSGDIIKECENELKASRYRLEQAESKFAESKNELKASRTRLEEVEYKLAETENGLEMAEAGLEATYIKRLDAETRCQTLEAELETLFLKVKSLENDVQKERELSGKAEAKCQELKDEVSRLENNVKHTKSVNLVEELQFRKEKQDMELAIAGSKFAECQKTIASLSRQLEKLATLDDFLMDTDDS